MELADQQNLENEGVQPGGEIPAEPASPAASSSSAPEKPLSIRDQLNKAVDTVRTEEAKRARDVTTGKFTKPAEPAAEIPATEIQAEQSVCLARRAALSLERDLG